MGIRTDIGGDTAEPTEMAGTGGVAGTDEVVGTGGVAGTDEVVGTGGVVEMVGAARTVGVAGTDEAARTVGAAEAVENGETVEEREGTGEAREGAKGPGDGDDPPADRTVRWRRLVTGALIAVLVMAGAGLLLRAQQLRDTPTTANHALTDAENTTRVAGDVSSALSKVFSYSPKDTAVTEEAAKRLLAGKALQQYAALFGQVEKEATDQRLTLTTHVVRAGVTRLSDRGAHLLVFLDQVYERQGKAATTAAAQLSVTAELRDGHWRIVDITSG